MKRGFLFVASCFWLVAFAQECPGGSPSTEGCRKPLMPLERRLATAEKQAEARLSASLREYGPDYVADAVRALQERNMAWRKLRDAECWYGALKDGMSTSPDYASPVAEACKVQSTRNRITWLSK